jgi:prolyl-tRNA synthetase
MMRDTRALQSGTSHFLGQNFAKAFEIRFLDQQRAAVRLDDLLGAFDALCWRNHHDPRRRPGIDPAAQAGPHPGGDRAHLPRRREKAQVMPVAERIQELCRRHPRAAGYRENLTPGFKFNDWEMRGVPLRMEIGPKDVQKGA